MGEPTGSQLLSSRLLVWCGVVSNGASFFQLKCQPHFQGLAVFSGVGGLQRRPTDLLFCVLIVQFAHVVKIVDACYFSRRAFFTNAFLVEMRPTSLIAVFRKFPKELFRVNNGLPVKLRVWTPSRRVYDIFAPNGMVEPKALNAATYVGKFPNQWGEKALRFLSG